MEKQLVDLDIGTIVVKPGLRDNEGDIDTLADSIRKMGLLCPIIVDRKNVVIAGGRRVEACKRVGVVTVPAIRIMVDHNSMEALEIQSDENLCRQPLSESDFEKLISRKKSAMSGKRVKSGAGSGSWLKRLWPAR